MLGRRAMVVGLVVACTACSSADDAPAGAEASVGGTSGSGATSVGSGGSPAGGDGIAFKYPGDVGIDSDPDVILADDFESHASASDLTTRWDEVHGGENVTIATDPANVFAGAQSLEFTIPQQQGEAGVSTVKLLTEELDTLFLRYYSKFQGPFDVVGSSHNGASMSAHFFVNGQASPGVPADGTNHFLASLENWRGEPATPSPGDLNIYIYHPEQRDIWGDHFFPSGFVMPYSPEPFDFGSDFVSRPDIIPELEKFYCYEYMLKANTPGQRDGRIKVWLDGELVADFGNLRMRDIDSLKIDLLMINLHIHNNPNSTARKWYDNVVAAKSYIGPMAQ